MKIRLLTLVGLSLLVMFSNEGHAKFPWKKKKAKSEQVKKATPYEKLFRGKKCETVQIYR